MTKVHTRVKRRRLIRTNLDGNLFLKTKKKEHRQKPFSNPDTANAWAVKNNLSLDSYSLKSVKHNKRVEILKKE